jgi:hypothetical protein
MGSNWRRRVAAHTHAGESFQAGHHGKESTTVKTRKKFKKRQAPARSFLHILEPTIGSTYYQTQLLTCGTVTTSQSSIIA